MNRSAYYSALPTILIDDENVHVMEKVLSLSVRESVEGLYHCDMTLLNYGPIDSTDDYLFFNRETFDFGKNLKIQIGDGEAGGEIFSGIITGIEGKYPSGRLPEIGIYAEDTLQHMRMKRRTRSFEETGDRDIIEQIARDHSLQTDIDIDGPETYKVVTQVNQSDLAFLRERARAVDAELWIADNTLYCIARGRREENEVTLSYDGKLREFQVLADVAHQCSEYAIGGWDYHAKESIASTAGNSVIQSELEPGQTSGTEELENAGIGPLTQQIVHATPFNESEARFLSESQYRYHARKFLSGHGLCEGDARIRVGTHLHLNGLGPLFEGRYYVREVEHFFNLVEGYQTQFRVERPGLGAAS